MREGVASGWWGMQVQISLWEEWGGGGEGGGGGGIGEGSGNNHARDRDGSNRGCRIRAQYCTLLHHTVV